MNVEVKEVLVPSESSKELPTRKTVLVARKDFESGDEIYKEHPVVAQLDMDLEVRLMESLTFVLCLTPTGIGQALLVLLQNDSILPFYSTAGRPTRIYVLLKGVPNAGKHTVTNASFREGPAYAERRR